MEPRRGTRRQRYERERLRRDRVSRALEARDELRSGADSTFARPLQYDESGFPIIEQPPSFAARVAQLLGVKGSADD